MRPQRTLPRGGLPTCMWIDLQNSNRDEVTSTEDPPYLISGMGTPVIGMIPTSAQVHTTWTSASQGCLPRSGFPRGFLAIIRIVSFAIYSA